MEFIERDITAKLVDYASIFPVVYLTGPRQSGKSTLLKHIFQAYRYVNLEEKDIREFALADPRGFLNGLGYPAIIDEAQRAPDLFSYIQTIADEHDEPGMYILSGSQNFLVMKNIMQSLAGRAGILTLLPFSDRELAAAKRFRDNTNDWMFMGNYPRLVARAIKPADFYPNYIKTYVERDVRLETGVQSIDRFSAFIRLCATGAGSPVNLSSIGNSIDADARTIASWLNILEESYIIFRLKAYTKRQSLRFSKKPKLYFYDTGLLCSLLGVASAEELGASEKRGLVFENAVIADYYKQVFNAGGFPGDDASFWRDSSNREKEVDLVIERKDHMALYEIKSAQTAKGKFADNLLLFERNADGIRCEKTVIYDGPHNMTINGTAFVNRRGVWNDK